METDVEKYFRNKKPYTQQRKIIDFFFSWFLRGSRFKKSVSGLKILNSQIWRYIFNGLFEAMPLHRLGIWKGGKIGGGGPLRQWRWRYLPARFVILDAGVAEGAQDPPFHRSWIFFEYLVVGISPSLPPFLSIFLSFCLSSKVRNKSSAYFSTVFFFTFMIIFMIWFLYLPTSLSSSSVHLIPPHPTSSPSFTKAVTQYQHKISVCVFSSLSLFLSFSFSPRTDLSDKCVC